MKKMILALAICLVLTACGNDGASKKNDNVKTEQVEEEKDRVEVLYFHGKQRCPTCIAIEKNVKKAIETQLADELKNGKVVFKTIDISNPDNEKITEKYEVTWSSLFICKWKDGKEAYENLTEYAFANARNAPDTFKNEIVEKIKASLK